MISESELFQSFKMATNDYTKGQGQKSKHWEGEYDNREVAFSPENLKNFRNNGLIDGLNRARNTDNNFIENHLNDLIQEVGEDFVNSSLDTKNIGNNLNFIKVKDKYVDVSDNFHIKFIYDMEKYIFSSTNIQVVCEIGGGYGNLVKHIKNKHNESKIILIDLPEANFYSAYYLQQHFPEAKILTYKDINDYTISKQEIKEYDFIVIPPWVKFSDDLEIDLFINTRSFMEMNYEIVEGYFNLIQKHIKVGGYFFNINKYYKNTVGHAVELDNYPYDNKWEVILSRPSWKQEIKIHQLITQRLSHDDDKLNLELKNIKSLKEKYLQKRKAIYFFEKFSLITNLLQKLLPKSLKEVIKKVINYN